MSSKAIRRGRDLRKGRNKKLCLSLKIRIESEEPSLIMSSFLSHGGLPTIGFKKIFLNLIQLASDNQQFQGHASTKFYISIKSLQEEVKHVQFARKGAGCTQMVYWM